MNTSAIVLWAAGVSLEIILFILILRRGITRRFPLFTALIAFYVVRSLVLFILFGHLPKDAYAVVTEVLSWVDLVLQLMVAGEIAYRVLRGKKTEWLRAALIAAMLVAVLTAVAVMGGIFQPAAYSDRAAAVVALVMLFVSSWMIFAGGFALAMRIAQGFGAFALLLLVADLLHHRALLHRSATLWTVANWITPAAWILIVVFWIFSLTARKARDLDMDRHKVVSA